VIVRTAARARYDDISGVVHANVRVQAADMRQFETKRHDAFMRATSDNDRRGRFAYVYKQKIIGIVGGGGGGSGVFVSHLAWRLV
jgi:hypothetical protein